MKKAILISPVLLTLLMLLWTALVCKYSYYGSWHIYPVLVIAPLVLICHTTLIVRNTPRLFFVLYAMAHLGIFIPLWIKSLMLISKDAL
jgi:hypothetical protein